MKLIDALNASDVETAEYVNENGICFVVDGSGDGYYVTNGTEGMPPHETKHFATREQAIAALPADVANIEQWEAIESE